MSDICFNHETWISKLKDHLEQERYASKTVSRCMAVARHFLASLEEQHVKVDTTRLANVEQYLQEARRRYRRRHSHPPDYKGWRWVQTSSIHMLLRWAQGQWPPISVAATPAQRWQQDICGEYAQWMSGLRGLSQVTVSDRGAEARRFLDWLGQRVIRGELPTSLLSMWTLT